MSDLPFRLPPELSERLARHLDAEGKLPRALEALGPVSGRDVALVDASDGLRARQLAELGARVIAGRPVGAASGAEAGTARPGFGLDDASVDVLIGFWTSFRGVDPAEIAAADRVLRPGGRLLVVHDYGRDDVSRLRPADLPEYGSWSRRDGPFLRGGFRIRVIHCWWTFDSIEQGQAFLADAFGAEGVTLGAAMRRPRLSYNVAIYHRSRPETASS